MSTYKREDFEILPHSDPERWPGEFRIRYTPTGEESQYSSYEECEQTIQHAINGTLLGSFLCGSFAP